jgi:hypothetical protein
MNRSCISFMSAQSATRLVLSAGLAVFLAGCGGGNGDGASVPGITTSAPSVPVGGDGTPAGSITTVDMLIAYLRSLVGSGNETGEPVALGSAALPTTETGDPASLSP